MKTYIKTLEEEFSGISNGFKEIEMRAAADFRTQNHNKPYLINLAKSAYGSDVYQVRMYAVFLFGFLAEDREVMKFMKKEVSKDDNWRVQEILAKAFDTYCRVIGYENSLSVIDEWLTSDHPNTRRAVTEGLRIWTGRPYFKDHPHEAIKRLSALKRDPSEYVRKSVGNSLKDISKKFPDLIKNESDAWTLDTKEIKQVYKLARKFIEKEP